MKKHMLIAGAAILALGFNVSAASAGADCSGVPNHPVAAKSLKSALVQAYVSCGNMGGNVANSATYGGVPGCAPPETFAAHNGNTAGTWAWGPKGVGTVTISASGNKVINVNDVSECTGGTNDGAICTNATECPGGTCDPLPVADLKLKLSMKGILDDLGDANGNGTLSTVARATLDDPAGLITVIDFPAGFPIVAAGGAIKFSSTANALLLGLGLPNLAACSTIELVSLNVTDPNGDTFAGMGAFIK